jgi:hypothetical protein
MKNITFKKIIIAGIIIVLVAGGIFGTMIIMHKIELSQVNKAMQGYFDTYKTDITIGSDKQIYPSIDKSYRDSVTEIGKRAYTKIDKSTYMVKTRKKAPDINACILKGNSMAQLSDLSGMTLQQQKDKTASCIENEFAKEENKMDYSIEVKIVKQKDNTWKAIESNGVKL